MAPYTPPPVIGCSSLHSFAPATTGVGLPLPSPSQNDVVAVAKGDMSGYLLRRLRQALVGTIAPSFPSYIVIFGEHSFFYSRVSEDSSRYRWPVSHYVPDVVRTLVCGGRVVAGEVALWTVACWRGPSNSDVSFWRFETHFPGAWKTERVYNSAVLQSVRPSASGFEGGWMDMLSFVHQSALPRRCVDTRKYVGDRPHELGVYVHVQRTAFHLYYVCSLNLM
ncbi:hypothetical protein L218DRAFT_237540 [Marasmius fiardii PR-910]|nr:hypothetical protein L218DRAFT_237540 [Marasmius fiardii PR-910]